LKKSELKMLNKVLVVASKCPTDVQDCDGGGMLVMDFAKILPNIFSSVDFLFLRKENAQWQKIYKEGNSYFIDLNNVQFEDKFLNRVHFSKVNAKIINKKFNNHELILVIHISNIFGINSISPGLWNRIVLFPMFTSASYQLSNEKPSSDYIALETEVMLNCQKIISPSKAEATLIKKKFPSLNGEISVIPRIVQYPILKKPFKVYPAKSISLINIASIKPQKNQIFLIESLSECRKKNLKVECHLVGGVQDKEYAANLAYKIKALKLEKYVHLHGACNRSKLLSIATVCHINITVSLWETFCRGFFEGASMGLPSMACRDLKCIWEYAECGTLIKHFERDYEHFYKCLHEIIENINKGCVFPSDALVFPNLTEKEVTDSLKTEIYKRIEVINK
jgi:glycosyltransferase involved in cell wall biosynthesis